MATRVSRLSAKLSKYRVRKVLEVSFSGVMHDVEEDEIVFASPTEGRQDHILHWSIHSPFLMSPKTLTQNPLEDLAGARSSVARFRRTRRGVESCNWLEIVGNERSVHPR